ncbi:histone H1C-like [Uloborus diversus]|uniref:histone H1C-like n=1 Tax=Uloborus diversus TaxID=327109 RepID=UPI0024099C1E|nr:histone H1C-like [Uloborus diversus]
MNAIRTLQALRAAQGTNLANIKTFLRNARNVDTKEKDAEIKMYLKNALDRGQLTREAGNYKVAAKAQEKRNERRKRKSAKSSPKRKSRKLMQPKTVKKAGTLRSRKRRSPKKSGQM